MKNTKSKNTESELAALNKSLDEIEISDESEVVGGDAENKEKTGVESIQFEGENGLENTVLKSMLNNGFPEKSDFINKEDNSSGEVLGTKTIKKASLPPKIKSNVAEFDMSNMFIKMFIGTVGLGLVVFLLALVWKWLQKKSGGFLKKGKNDLSIVSQQMIGPKSKVIIIEAMGKKYLIGATDVNIQLLADIDFYESAGDVVSDSQSSLASKGTFNPVGNQNVSNIINEISHSESSKPATTGAKAKQRSLISKNQTKSSARIKEKLKSLKRLG
ncbi:hypothetical protein BVY03_05380 [bacterium K02(2017)]|nr:hypothetical protein BVY03_05380 [bacterium K02(2017)]